MKINGNATSPHPTTYSYEQQGKLPYDLYQDSNGDVVLVNNSGYVVGVIVGGELFSKGRTAWPIIQALPGTEVSLRV